MPQLHIGRITGPLFIVKWCSREDFKSRASFFSSTAGPKSKSNETQMGLLLLGLTGCAVLIVLQSSLTEESVEFEMHKAPWQ